MEKIDWNNLTFGYMKTDYNVRSYYKDGKWSPLEATSSDTIDIHMAATSLHYGQEAFEGLKAFRNKEGQIRVFRMRENALRMAASCRGVMMAEVPIELFEEAIIEVVKKNERFVPPYETGCSLYIRPMVIGMTPQVGVRPGKDFLFLVFAMPVGVYFKDGFKPTPMVILRSYDRAAPLGTGTIKVGGNYAAGMIPGEKAHEMGYSSVLYLDAKEKKYIDECGPANFFAIKDNTYVTPLSNSILPSITNKSLMQIAEDLGYKVERRPIPEDELSTFEEAGACGTAAIITPISRIDDVEENKSYVFTETGKAGPITTKIYERLRGIQYGDEPDTHNWMTLIK